ncbi:dihydroorotate dehydrogenase [Clostridium bovifaecis]|uniref:Dihydroorotate dehydrogenase n=1 Tax=Clostridium bovifaecis TaxID=2184719 RepID=A0A6I6F3C8_9CLOT|nr:dihydroorotate dehydrogenase [Clostridium bovifaecis]
MQVLDILDDFKETDEEWKVGKSNYWILINKNEIDMLKNKIVLDEESLKLAANSGNNSSKIIFFDGYMFLSFSILGYKNSIVKSRDLNIYVSKDYIVTICDEDISIIQDLIQDINEMKNCFMLKNNPRPSMVLYYLLDRIIVKNYNIIAKIEAKADEIELAILKNPSHEQADDLIHLRRQLYKLRKYLNPLRYVGDSLASNDNSIIDEKDIEHFKNINVKINKLMSTLESLVQDLALVREAFESEIANKTNDLMKIFTIITSIFLPLNLLTSMQGMNFDRMPFSNSPYGYYYIMLIMIIISGILIYVFRRKKWL